MLSESDWTDLPNAPLTEEKKLEWQHYRQQLRDFPSIIDYSLIDYRDDLHIIENVPWPEKPA